METQVAVVTAAPNWAEHVTRQAASGLTAAAYCRANGLKVHHFLYRRQQLGSGANESAGFVQLHTTTRLGSGLRVEHRSGWAFYVEPGVDEATLTTVARALSAS